MNKIIQFTKSRLALYNIIRKRVWAFRWQFCCSAFFFIFACVYGLGQWMKPAQLSVELVSEKDVSCTFMTATHMYRGTQGEAALKVILHENEKKHGTSLWIRYLWLENTEKGNSLTIRNITINDDVLSPDWIINHLDNSNKTVQIDQNNNLTFSGILRVKTDEIQTNKEVSKRIICIIMVCMTASLVFLLISITLSKVVAWNKKKSYYFLVGIQFACLVYILWKIAYEHWNLPYWFVYDTETNLTYLASFVKGEGYLFDPYITAGPGYLIPLGLLLKTCSTYSLSIITNCIFVVNYLFLLLPIIIVFLFSSFRLNDKIFFSLVYLTIWLLSPSIYENLDFLPQLYGEMSATAVFFAGCLLFAFAKKNCITIISGILLGWSCHIKTVCEVLLACLIVIAIVRLMAGKDDLFSWKRIIYCLLGFLFVQICVISFEIYSLGGWTQYLIFRHNNAAFNAEGGIRLSLWNRDFFFSTVKQNYIDFLTYTGGVALVLLVSGFFYSLFIIFRKNIKEEELVIFAMLMICSFGSFLFWLGTQSWDWHMRNLETSFFCFLAAIVCYIVYSFRNKISQLQHTLFCSLLLLFWLIPYTDINKKVYNTPSETNLITYKDLIDYIETYTKKGYLVYADYIQPTSLQKLIEPPQEEITSKKKVLYIHQKNYPVNPYVVKRIKSCLFENNTWLVLSSETQDNNDSLFYKSDDHICVTGNNVLVNTELTSDKDRLIMRGTKSELFFQRFIPVEAGSFTIRAKVKNVGDVSSRIYLGVAAYSSDFINLSAEHYAFKSGKTLCVVSSNKDSILVDSYPEDWTKGCFLALNTKDDLSDIPNCLFVEGCIQDILKRENDLTEIKMDRPIKRNLEAGTKVRVHGVPNGNIYMCSIILQPGERWESLEATIPIDHESIVFSNNAISKGIKYIKPLCFSYSTNPLKENVIEICDFEFSCLQHPSYESKTVFSNSQISSPSSSLSLTPTAVPTSDQKP